MAEPKPITRFSGRYAFLSNFYPSPVEFEKDVYPTVEHAFQAAKTLRKTERRRIRDADTASMAKRMGRLVSLREDWNHLRHDVMLTLLREKFSDEELRDDLIATHPRRLIEGNTWGDRFWGAELKAGQWHGENHLGRLLMEVRKEILDV